MSSKNKVIDLDRKEPMALDKKGRRNDGNKTMDTKRWKQNDGVIDHCDPADEIEICKSKIVSYGFTLRRTKDPEKYSEQMLKEYMVEICSKTKSYLEAFVIEQRPSLHAHGIIQINKRTPLYKFRVRGWKLYLEEIYDNLGWIMYITKQMVNPPCDDCEPDIPIPEDIDIQSLRAPLWKQISTKSEKTLKEEISSQ